MSEKKIVNRAHFPCSSLTLYVWSACRTVIANSDWQEKWLCSVSILTRNCLLQGSCSKEFCHFFIICFWYLGAITDNPGLNDSSYGVNKTNSFLCPVGHYCESGDLRPRACPNGTYNDALNASHSGQCKPCKKGHFNDKTGQKECRLCGEGTAKEQGSDLCSCQGLNRVFKVLIANANTNTKSLKNMLVWRGEYKLVKCC